MNASPVIGISPPKAHHTFSSRTKPKLPCSPRIDVQGVENTSSDIADECIQRSVLQDITHIEPTSPKVRSKLPSEAWMTEQMDLVFGFTTQGGARFLDKILKVAQLNLKTWGSLESLSELVNATNCDGKTPLECAIDRRSPKHIKILRKYGAEVTSSILEYGERKLPTYIYRELT